MLNNLEIKKCLYGVLAILSVLLGLVGLAALGFDIPVLRQIVGFIFLTFVPGILILRILKVHNISTAESLVYSVGLSLAFIMFTGVLVNSILPLFGILKPISTFPLIITVTVAILILCAIAYTRDKDFLTPRQPNPPPIFSPPYLFLILLPLLAILGALLVNYHQNNILLLIFILIVAATVALVAFGKFIPERAYPLVIVIIAIAFLYYFTLSSSFLVGFDVHSEYLYQDLVAQSGYWNSARAGILNTALSITMLCPIFSVILNMDAVWVFKVIYPLFFCLVPLALFQAYCEQIGSKKAFFSTFFLMSVISFLVLQNRQQVAELFFALLILLMVDRKLPRIQKSALAIIFVLALPVSHYGLAYICLSFFVIGWLLLILMKSKTVADWWRNLTRRFGSSPATPELAASTPPVTSILTGTLVCLYVVFTLTWYMYTASGSAFTTIVNIPQHVYSNISEFFNPVARESLVGTATGADFVTVFTLGKGFRIFQYITQLFIIIGFVKLLLKPKDFKFRAEFIVLILMSALILLACLALPYFSSHLGLIRFYHITLFLLSPLCILGAEATWQGLSRLLKSSSSRLKFKGGLASPFNSSRPSSNYLRFIALGVLIPYFLFNTGFIFEVTNCELNAGIPISTALSSDKVDPSFLNHRDVKAGQWLAENRDDSTPAYTDTRAATILRRRAWLQTHTIPASGKVPADAYIVLRTWNTERRKIAIILEYGSGSRLEHMSLSSLPALFDRNLIYSNGGGQVLAP